MLGPMSAPAATPEKVGRGMAIMLVLTGIGHFIFGRAVDRIVPSFLPGDPRVWTYLSGVAEIAIALMLLVPLAYKNSWKIDTFMGRLQCIPTLRCCFPSKYQYGNSMEFERYAGTAFCICTVAFTVWTFLLGVGAS